uniref:PR/SET domain 14 n=1 Tax=Phasianus colchicus TaxID=9054 RepID=A0A669QU88_PHACC
MALALAGEPGPATDATDALGLSPAGLAAYYPPFLPPAQYLEAPPDFFQPLGRLLPPSPPLPPFGIPAFLSLPPPPSAPPPPAQAPADTPQRTARPGGCCETAGQSRRFHFSEEELNAVLYGALRNPHMPGGLHAISGLRVPPVSPGAARSPPAPPPDGDALQLPEGLAVLRVAYGDVWHLGVFCTAPIPKGVRFGPFQGKVVNTTEIKTYDDNSLMWEVFEYGQLSHFIDGKGTAGNWMSLVNCARFPEEQNLTALQCQGQIFYESCREIAPKEELLVWYGDCYVQFLGIPICLKGMPEAGRPPQHPEGAGESFKCERCGKVFAYRYYRDKHLKYTRCVDRGDRKFPCHLCSRSFEKRDRLRIHVLHVHEKHRPHKVRRPRRYLGVFGRCFVPPDRSLCCLSRAEAVGRSESPKRRTRREPLPRQRRAVKRGWEGLGEFQYGTAIASAPSTLLCSYGSSPDNVHFPGIDPITSMILYVTFERFKDLVRDLK